MKKFLSLLLVFSLTLVFTACNLEEVLASSETSKKSLSDAKSDETEIAPIETKADKDDTEEEEIDAEEEMEEVEEVEEEETANNEQDTAQEESEDDDSSDSGVISAEYEITKPFPIIEQDGNYYFDMSGEELIKKINAQNDKYMNTPFAFHQIPADEMTEAMGSDEFVGAIGDNQLFLFIKMNNDIDKVEAVLIGTVEELLPEGETNALTYTAVQSIGALTALDPNMTIKYAGLYLTDIAIAGMFTYSEDIYAYGSHLGEIGYGVVKVGDMLMFQFVPTFPEQ